MKLISVVLKSDFGFFRKPDANGTINLTYNMLHKPALLGILGAIIGLDGYKEKGKWPEYYEKLKDLKIGIEPLNHENGNFQKTVIKYTNTIGYANKDGNYITEESTLIKPSYKIYLLLDVDTKEQKMLFDNIRDGKSEYIPYFGKNEFNTWWESESFEEYRFDKIININNNYKISTLFEKSKVLIYDSNDFLDLLNIDKTDTPFLYFERLPKGFNEELMQYELGDFVFTTFNLKSEYLIDNLYHLIDKNKYVQLY